jgi:hypothetical protein
MLKQYSRRDKLEQLAELVEWLQECKAVDQWLHKHDTVFVKAYDENFLRFERARCEITMILEVAEKTVYNWRP